MALNRAGTVLVVMSLVAPDAPRAQPACLPATGQTYAATGAVQTFSIPNGVAEVWISALGGRGGDIDDEGPYVGGLAATASGVVTIDGPATLNVVVGQGGQDSIDDGAGGGGGSFVYNASGNVLLAAAGGGGGAGISQAGHDAETGPNGGSADPPDGGAGGVGGNGGGASTAPGENAGGGGGFLSAGGDGFGANTGLGGHRVSPPGDAGGGAGYGGDGGFGGGGGGSNVGGGGGGGFSGGGGGYGEESDGGGGGGSFLAAGASEALIAVADSESPDDGTVFLCITSFEPGVSILEVPALGPAGLALFGLILAFAGGWVARRRLRA